MDKFHYMHLLHLAETMLSDAREMEYSSLAQETTYGKVDLTGWRLEWKQPSIRIYGRKDGSASFLIVATSRKRKYLRYQDYGQARR